MKGCSSRVSSVVAAAKYCSLTTCRFHPFSKHPTISLSTREPRSPSPRAPQLPRAPWGPAFKALPFSTRVHTRFTRLTRIAIALTIYRVVWAFRPEVRKRSRKGFPAPLAPGGPKSRQRVEDGVKKVNLRFLEDRILLKKGG